MIPYSYHSAPNDSINRFPNYHQVFHYRANHQSNWCHFLRGTDQLSARILKRPRLGKFRGNVFIAMLGPEWYKLGIVLDFRQHRHWLYMIQTPIDQGFHLHPSSASFFVCLLGFVSFFCGEVLKDSLSDAIPRLPRIF